MKNVEMVEREILTERIVNLYARYVDFIRHHRDNVLFNSNTKATMDHLSTMYNLSKYNPNEIDFVSYQKFIKEAEFQLLTLEVFS